MPIKNSKEAYGLIAKIFHWPTALIIMALILVGLYMGSMENGPDKLQVYMLHKSFGILVLWLVGLRIIWRLINQQPAPHANHQLWERLLAKVTHLFLYVAMIGMPLSGWLMSSAAEYPVPFFGFQIPDLVDKNLDFAHQMREVHEVLAFVLMGAIFLHALGALKHHFIDKDSTLTRMAAGPMKRVGPYLVIVVLTLFGLGILGLSLFGKEEESKPKVEEVSEILESSSDYVGDNVWKIIKDQSNLTFRGSVYKKEFTGTFPNFDGKIVFNPDDLKNSQIDITIDIASARTGDEERDAQMMTDEWFDVATFPTAHFRTIDFEKKEGGSYLAIGELILKNRSMPLVLPFQLDIVKMDEKSTKAYVDGAVTLNRLDFGLGEGRWKAADNVGLDVIVDIKLIATSN